MTEGSIAVETVGGATTAGGSADTEASTTSAPLPPPRKTDPGAELPPDRFLNRELSWLDFGSRLLELADDDSLPLFERVKFLAIFSDGLDEFFQVRVAGLEDQVAAGLRSRSPDGMRPLEQLNAITGRVTDLVDRQSRIFLDRVVPLLAEAGVVLSDWHTLDEDDRTYLVEVFHQQIFPVLTPLAVDPGHPFPYISNLSLNLVVRVVDPATTESRIARVKVPPLLPRFVVMPDGERFVPLEQVIAAHLDMLFPAMTIGEHYAFRVTRNADLSVGQDEAGDLLAAVELELQRRRFGEAVRLEIAADATPAIRDLLVAEVDVPPESVYAIEGPIDLSGLWAVAGLDRPDLSVEPWIPITAPPLAPPMGTPISPPPPVATRFDGTSSVVTRYDGAMSVVAQFDGASSVAAQFDGTSPIAAPAVVGSPVEGAPGVRPSPAHVSARARRPASGSATAQLGDGSVDIFAVLRDQDVLVHHPYDSFATSIEAFVGQAADDPDVLAIKQTLYRTSGDSPIVASLIRASQSGKQVAALVELQARFDEQANIAWARALEEAGVHVVYGLAGLKTHSKTALVARREADGVRRYCHIGTGNYNSRTALNYEDLGLLTSNEELATDVGNLFNYLTGFSRQADYQSLVIAPVSLRNRLLDWIDAEARAGSDGRIILKANGLTDPAVIDGLYRASGAGVPIDLIIRGRCCLRPGVPGLSENIRVRSIVGRFLEHSRIYRFGGVGDRPLQITLGSADLMERNLDRRIEAMVPIEAPDLQERLVRLLDLALMDDANTWTLRGDGSWARLSPGTGVSLQDHLRQDALKRAQRSVHAAPEAPPVSTAVPRRFRWLSFRWWRRRSGGRRHPATPA
ncbi:MAG: polyphosphate kinase 1 [Acidimicrobiales bacterium]|jgi:polyphosphate kinase